MNHAFHAWGIALLLLAAVAPGVATAAGPPRPDLIVDPNRVVETWTSGFRYFEPGDCAIEEGCVGGPGLRRLLTFSVLTANIGQYDLELGDPTTSPYFAFSPCHGHFHLIDFSDYQIQDLSGTPLGAGHKQDWCMGDFFQYIFEPWVPNPPIGYDCDNQGLSPGWADEYSAAIPCQWVDVTGLAPGDYQLRVDVNAAGNIQETDYGNNTVIRTVTLSDPNALPDLLPDQPTLASTWQIEKVRIKPGDRELADGCVGDYGWRRVVSFMGRINNIGMGDFFLGDPANSSWFVNYPTHGHDHLPGFLEYQLFSGAAPATPPRRQELWFPTDWLPALSDPWVRAQTFYRIGNHGIQRGFYARTFTVGTECQWLDVTDVPDGIYQFRVTVNPDQIHAESDLSNNTVSAQVQVKEPATGIAHLPDGAFVPGTPLTLEVQPTGLIVHYDTAACPVQEYNLFYSYLDPALYQYSGAICNLGTGGSFLAQIPNPVPGNMIWFTVAGANGTIEGGHGFDSEGRERPLSGAGLCGITQTIPRKSCFAIP